MTRTPTDLQRLLAEEPFVRSLTHALLVDEPDDVVQQAFLTALQHRPATLARPRAWLARIVRNLVTDRRRRDQRRAARERVAAVSERVPSSAELLEAEERRRVLVAAVDRLPPLLRTVVLLRYYEGLPPRRIATELQLPVTTVSNRLRSALQTLRQRLDADHGGDRRAWLVALVPFAAEPRALPWNELRETAGLRMGVLAMTTKSKILAGAALLLTMVFALVLWPGTGMPAGPAPAGMGAPPGPEAAHLGHDAVPGPAASVPQREPAPASAPAGAATGTLVVHVRYADDHAPAVDVMVLAWPGGTDRIWGSQRLRTDDGGSAVFVGVRPGRTLVTTGRSLGDSTAAEVRAGATTELDLELAGFTLTGVVVDAAGTPVAEALVELVPPAATLPEPVAVTGTDGRFRVRAVRSPNLVGARASGYASSECLMLMHDNGGTAAVQLVLAAAGGIVEGLVAGPDGPVAGAVVQVGHPGESGRARNPPQPAVVHSDVDGHFRAIGVALGEQPVQVRVGGLAPWCGTCEVVAQRTTSLQVQLQPGATIRGVVRDADGAPVSGAVVSVGGGSPFNPLAWFAARSLSGGTFVLNNLPAGDVEVRASHERAGKTTMRVRTAHGVVAECELLLSRGLELRGRVLREDDTPVAGAQVSCWWRNGSGSATTDVLGRFTIANCPEGTVGVGVVAPGMEELRQLGIDPRAGEAELRVRSVATPSARITGRVVDLAGQPLADLTVEAGREGQSVTLRTRAATGPDGRFEFGPLVPGRWYLSLAATGYPDFEKGPIELGAGAAHDAGAIRLVKGGTARVRLVAGDPTGVQFLAWREGRLMGELQLGAGEVTSRLLAPGDYELTVLGNGTAEQSVPFAVRAGEETRFELRLLRGVRQRLEVAIPAGATAGGKSIQLLVRRGEDLVRRLSLGTPTDAGAARRTAEVWLTPGSYALAVNWGSLQATAPFTVGSEEGPRVQVELR